MARRGIEPDEALGPVVNGLEELLPLLPGPEQAAETGLENEEVEPDAAEPMENESIEEPVALVCGDCELAREFARLAKACGFIIEVAARDEQAEGDAPGIDAGLIREVKIVPDWHDFVNICGVDRNYFVCIFLADEQECEDIVYQCLASEATYLGVLGDPEKRKEIFAGLRDSGAPDAELAAIACPMGLNIGAVTDPQQAVAIVAEIMAAKAGTLKRLRYGERRPAK